jgi:hypothetical protein
MPAENKVEMGMDREDSPEIMDPLGSVALPTTAARMERVPVQNSAVEFSQDVANPLPDYQMEPLEPSEKDEEDFVRLKESLMAKTRMSEIAVLKALHMCMVSKFCY